jgi:hypothetical protein
VSEWSKEQHWKCCVGQPTEGSNPSPSAIFLGENMSEKNTNEDHEKENTKIHADSDMMYLTRGDFKQFIAVFEKVVELEQRIAILEQKNE